ncbi:MAG: rhodanese-like domain-containing protein [Thermodesulfobacteriota bacterium]|nr:rhodanese-like domain-containing protein [Thermodesulfobacteriota bacterium]
MKNQIKKILWQISAIVVIAVVLGLSVNFVRTDSLILKGDWTAAARLTTESGDRLLILPEKAEELFVKKKVVFLDARSGEDYDRGHIKGALSLPWSNVEEAFMTVVQKIPLGMTIITYCDGETCELSHDLALFLINSGFNNVKVFINGWTVWQNKNLPVDKETA